MSGQPRQHLAQRGIAASAEAEQAVDAIRALVAVPDEFEDAPDAAVKLRLEIVEQIRKAFKERHRCRSWRRYARKIPLERPRVAYVHAMVAAIADDAETIPVENVTRREVETAMKAARRSGDRQRARELSEKLASMPPYRKPANAATRQRIRATLRTALTAACAQQLITVNVAALAELESGKRPKAVVWTPERVARWRQTGEVP